MERDKLWNTQSVGRSKEEKLFYKPWRGRIIIIIIIATFNEGMGLSWG